MSELLFGQPCHKFDSMNKIIIAAITKNLVIGRSNGEMLWKSKEELAFFKKTTIGFPVIMGRKTFESIGKPLIGRTNIILTSNSNFGSKFNELIIYNNLAEALKFCEERDFEKVFIIGGRKVFVEAINYADQMFISYMNFEAEGDIYFPSIDLKQWKIFSQEKKKDFKIIIYERKY